MEPIYRASLRHLLRQNVINLWRNSFLFCPQTTTVIGDGDLVKVIRDHCPSEPVGVITRKDAELLHTLIVPADKSRDWFAFCCRQRSRWWQRYSRNWQRFIACGVDSNHVEMRYNFERRNDVVETLHREQTDGGGILIESRFHVDAATDSLDHDATDLPAVKNKPKLRWHYKLAPYQVSVAVISDSDIPQANELLTQLKHLHVRCLPEVRRLGESSNRFTVEDSLGVCFNVYPNDVGGIQEVWKVRNRDTATAEEIHYPELAWNLTKYLKSEMIGGELVEEPPNKKLVVVNKKAAIAKAKPSSSLNSTRSRKVTPSTRVTLLPLPTAPRMIAVGVPKFRKIVKIVKSESAS